MALSSKSRPITLNRATNLYKQIIVTLIIPSALYPRSIQARRTGSKVGAAKLLKGVTALPQTRGRLILYTGNPIKNVFERESFINCFVCYAYLRLLSSNPKTTPMMK